MRAMKDSGVEWIGEIPAEWEIGKVKKYYKIATGFTPNTQNIDYYDDNGVDWITISDLDNGYYIPEVTKSHISKKYLELYNPTIIPKGSLLYSFKLSVGQVAFTNRDIFTNEAIASFLPTDNVNLKYLYYSSMFIIENSQNNIYGAKLLNKKLINNAYIVFPPLHEQQRIADYLDKKCAEIDAIISKQHSIIEKLQEYKLSLITETVTKGLNADAEMKDSGIEWIGEIPKHWKIKKLKYITKSIGDGIHSTPSYDDNGNIFFVNGNNIGEDSLVLKESTSKINEEEYYRYKLPALNNNTILITLNGATYGKTSFYNQEKILLGKSAGYIILNESENKKFLRYYLQSYYSKQSMDLSLLGSTIQNLSLKTLRNFNIVYPSLNEQKDIVCFLDKKCMNIESIINKKISIIEKLTQYKKSLIYEVVTGKKEV